MKIGIDLDNTINENNTTISFFSFITNAMKGKWEIFIITNRDDSEKSRQKTIEELNGHGIYYDKLVITPDKHDYIIENGINVYVDDTDEYYLKLPESIVVFKIREAGNFDFENHKWVYGDKTGINIDDKRKNS